MKCFGLTDKGRVRKDNQDSFIIEKCEAKNCLIVGLCDGMGGAKAGGLASQLSNKAFVDFVYGKLTSRVERVQNYKNMLQSACDEANGVSYEYSKFDEAYNGMGTTIVGGVIKNSGKAHIINVGDSRAYHISRKSSSIYQITRDHSLVEELVEFGAITKEQAKTHPQRNVITRALGSEAKVESDYFELSMRLGDAYSSARTACRTPCRIRNCWNTPCASPSRSCCAGSLWTSAVARRAGQRHGCCSDEVRALNGELNGY